MNLNLEYLLDDLRKNEQEILDLIHNDPKLTKRECPQTGLFIANASKELFTPEKQHQLYAKGIVYERKLFQEDEFSTRKYAYKLISLGYIKIYNYNENQLAQQHVSKMIAAGAEPVHILKYDGTWIGRFIYDGKVYLCTRGMMETMAETDEQKRFFEWARAVIDSKYPNINSTDYLSAGTTMYELIGPDNQIVTHYKEWDLVMTGFVRLSSSKRYYRSEHRYWSHSEVIEYCSREEFGKPASRLYVSGGELDLQIDSLNKLFSATDDEGSVIQFEVTGRDGEKSVIGRIKAKTDTYRRLLKLMNGCNYKAISTLIRSDIIRFEKWDDFKSYLMSVGSANYPEELMDSYEQYFNEFWVHTENARKLLAYIQDEVAKIIDKNKIKFLYGSFGSFILDKSARAKFAFEVRSHNFKGMMFSVLDCRLTDEDIRDKLFEDPQELKNLIREINKK